ncbi:copper chaperone PCu(A)C [Altericroceibacterium xinjiangense]|uniref:copper chaperone PCu(A)C n=1 Tax=Altericroceibacterium xinjiangense TaxID=762261 RepID=UPI0013E0512F|nr:copper chaperone PCu(A)C [Altericroceibacterium xinjiangense]
MKSAILAGLTLGIAVLGLAACDRGEEPVAETSVQDTAPDAPDGIAVSNGRIMLPAVPGNPAAVYFDIANTGAADKAIEAAFVTGAESAMVHTMSDSGMGAVSEVAVRPNSTVRFEPGGLHVMAMNLDPALAPGSTAEVTLTFVGGDKVSFPAQVRAAGDER